RLVVLLEGAQRGGAAGVVAVVHAAEGDHRVEGLQRALVVARIEEIQAMVGKRARLGDVGDARLARASRQPEHGRSGSRVNECSWAKVPRGHPIQPTRDGRTIATNALTPSTGRGFRPLTPA